MPTSAQTGPRPRSGLRSLTVVLPAYNEAKRLGPALDELFGYLDGPTPEGVHPRIDVLVVDDGSTDGTAELVLARAEASRPIQGDEARLELLRVKHAGKGSAVRSGIFAAAGELVVFADADMATPPSELPKLVAAHACARARSSPCRSPGTSSGSRCCTDRSASGDDAPAHRLRSRPVRGGGVDAAHPPDRGDRRHARLRLSRLRRGRRPAAGRAVD